MHFLAVSLLVAATTALPWKRQEAENTTQQTGSRLIPVVVGGSQDIFLPNRVTATPGDIIQFQFSSGNHTVTQSTEEAACTPMEGGVHSGHIPFQAGQEMVGTFNMLVTNEETMFLYCATGPHCQTGQVMIVNPGSDQQILEYANKAAAAADNVDGTDVIGGIVGEIPVANAAFVPQAEEEEAPPPPPAEAPPAEGEAPLAEAPPAEGEAPPAEAPPAEGEAPPAEAPPAEGEAPPAEGETPPPAEGEAPPPEAETPPAEGEAPPAEPQAAEAEAEAEPMAPMEPASVVTTPIL